MPKLTKRGIFRDKKYKPGEKTPEGNMPDIFKITRVEVAEGEEPRFAVTNERGNWKAELTWTQAPTELISMMADRNKIYIIAVPEASGLTPQSIISDQNW